MSVLMRAADLLGRTGFAVQRHPAARRQHLLRHFGIDLVVDVGAAGGGYGEQLRSFGYRGEICSFEPMAAPFAQLQERAVRDGHWQARNLALGARPGRAPIHRASNGDSSSLLSPLPAHRAAAPEVEFTGSEEVTLAVLDDEVDAAMLADRRVFLKLDTQGYEGQVLAGGERVVAAAVGLQLELSFVPLYDGGMVADEAIGWAYRHGFHLTGFEQGFSSPSGAFLQADGIFFRAGGEAR
ncbi:MAG: FkbM family methyltransferase [Marmoricola sp.]